MVVALWNVSNGAWSAIAAWVGLGLAVFAGWFAWVQFRESQRTRAEQAAEAERRRAERQQTHEEEAQPYVVIYAEPAPGNPHVVELVIKNFGATVAKDIKVSVTPTLFRYGGGGGEAVELPELIRTLVPDQEWRTLWDGTTGTTHLHEDPHTATIEFRDARHRLLGPYTFILDWGHISGRWWPSPRGMAELTEAAEGIRDVLKSWKAAGNAPRVHAYDGFEQDKREREHWEQRRQALQQRETEQSQDEPSSG